MGGRKKEIHILPARHSEPTYFPMVDKFFSGSREEGLQVGGRVFYRSLAEPGTGLGGGGGA